MLRRFAGKLPDNWKSYLPKYSLSDSPVGTRKLSEQVINKIADIMPEFFGGSADLTGSNLTRWKTAIDFQPVNIILFYFFFKINTICISEFILILISTSFFFFFV